MNRATHKKICRLNHLLKGLSPVEYTETINIIISLGRLSPAEISSAIESTDRLLNVALVRSTTSTELPF